MSSQNYFDLLGDDENEEPSAVVIRATLPSAAAKSTVKKVQISVGAPARLHSKLPPSSEPPKDHKLIESGRGDRGSLRGGRGGRASYGDRDRESGSRELSVHRDSRDVFSRERGGLNSDRHFLSNRESDNDGSQGLRGGVCGGISDRAAGTIGAYAETGLSEGIRGRGGRGGGRGRERSTLGDGEDRPRRREFDRRSGSGFSNEVKRDGSGRGNWGAEGDEGGSQQELEDSTIKQQTNQTVAPEREIESETQPGGTATDNSVEQTGEDGDYELTLDEYEKILEERRKALLASKAEERKVKADKAFDSMHLVDKKNDQDVFIKLGSDKEKKKKEALEKEEKSRKTQSINEFLKPVDGEKCYGPIGNRGRGRSRAREGRGGENERTGGFGGRSNLYGGFNSTRRSSAPRIEDPGQFPTLGAK